MTSKTKTPPTIRLEVTTEMGHATYLIIKKGKVEYVSGNETKLALTSIAGDKAAVLRMKLEDATHASDAAKAVRELANFARHVKVLD
jgi:ribosomal protein L11